MIQFFFDKPDLSFKIVRCLDGFKLIYHILSLSNLQLNQDYNTIIW